MVNKVSLQTINKTAIVLLLASFSLFSLCAYAQQTPGMVLEPRWSHPIATLQGESVSIKIVCPVAPQYIRLVSSWHNETITDFATSLEGNIYAISFKMNVPQGLYDLEVKCGNIEIISPKSIMVYTKWPEKLRIAHISDTHIGLILDNGRSSDSYLLQALMVSMLLNSDLIIHTGDTVDVGAMSKDYYTLYRITNLANLPTFVVPGNHDYSGDSALSNYASIVGKNVYYARWGPYLFVGLDTGYYGRLTHQQLDFFEKVLKENYDASIKIVFFHHPVFNTKLVGRINGDPSNLINNANIFYPSWREAPEITVRLLELVGTYNVNLVLSGHTHADGLVLYNNKTYFVTTVTTGGGVREGDYRGLKIIDVYSNGTVIIVPKYNSDLFDPTIAINLDKANLYYVFKSTSLIAILEGGDKEIINMLSQSPKISFRLLREIDKSSNLTILAKSENAEFQLYYAPNLNEVGLYIHNLKENFVIQLGVTNTQDVTPPQIAISQIKPNNPVAGKDRVELVIRVTDEDWGIKNVWIEYKLPNGYINRVFAFPYLEEYYSAKLPLLPTNIPEIEVRGIAEDFAGHSSSTEWRKIVFLVPTPTTTSLQILTTPPKIDTTTTTTTTRTDLLSTTTQPQIQQTTESYSKTETQIQGRSAALNLLTIIFISAVIISMIMIVFYKRKS